MPINSKYLAKFEGSGYYHVFNRSHSDRRIFVEDKNYHFFLRHLSNTISYIHHNPIHHNICVDILGYKFCSYQSIIKGNDVLVNTQLVLDWFGGMEEFLSFHNKGIMDFRESSYYIE
jgi:hypothetical protein